MTKDSNTEKEWKKFICLQIDGKGKEKKKKGEGAKNVFRANYSTETNPK